MVPDLPDRTPGIDDAPPPLQQSEPDGDNSASLLVTNDDVLGTETADAAAATGGMTNGDEFSDSGEATADGGSLLRPNGRRSRSARTRAGDG